MIFVSVMFAPAAQSRPETTDYHNIPIDDRNPLYNEELVELSSLGIACDNYYARPTGNPPYNGAICGSRSVRVRKTVAGMLAKVNDRLAPLGFEVLVLDGYRSIDCQRALWRFFVERASRENPTLGSGQIIRLAARYCSDPRDFDRKNPRTWPVHTTGGAVDLTLREKSTGKVVDMGSAFDVAGPVSHTAYFDRKISESPHTQTIYRRAAKNRRILSEAMQKCGFSNYPNEWWHYDYGDQMWQRYSGGGKKALYGLVENPDQAG